MEVSVNYFERMILSSSIRTLGLMSIVHAAILYQGHRYRKRKLWNILITGRHILHMPGVHICCSFVMESLQFGI